MDICPCGSEKTYSECCEPLIRGACPAPTAEALMRARYSAHVKTEINYIHDTIHIDRREGFDRKQSTSWSKNMDWVSLEILHTEKGGMDDDQGVVEFVARYRDKGKLCQHHEVAEFIKEDQNWYFVDGHTPRQEQSIRKGPKIGRNQPCPCGSGKKYKKCCNA